MSQSFDEVLVNARAHRQPPPGVQDAAQTRSLGQSLARLISKNRPVTPTVTDAGRKDVMAYKARIDADRDAILAQLVADAQEHDMGYGTP